MSKELEILTKTNKDEVEKLLEDKIVSINEDGYDTSKNIIAKNPDLKSEYDAAKNAFMKSFSALYKTDKPTIGEIIDFGKRIINNAGNPFFQCSTLNNLSKQEKIQIYFDLIQEPLNITLDVDAEKFVEKLEINYNLTKDEKNKIIKNGYVKTFDGYDENKIISFKPYTFIEKDGKTKVAYDDFENTIENVNDRYGFLTEEYVTRANVDDSKITDYAEHMHKKRAKGVKDEVTTVGESTAFKLKNSLTSLYFDIYKKDYIEITDKIMDQINKEYKTKTPSIEQLLDYSKKVALGKFKPFEGSTKFKDLSMREKVQAVFELVQKPLNIFIDVDSDMIMKEFVYGYKHDEEYRKIKDEKNRRYLPLDHQKEINIPVDDDYTKNDRYGSKLWEDEYEESDLTRYRDDQQKLIDTLYMNDSIIQNCMNNKDEISSDKLKDIKEMYKQCRDDLYAFAASMRNEVKMNEDGSINLRSFIQFCSRAYDQNNEPFNNLVKKGYFHTDDFTDIDAEDFFKSCANEVYHVNLLNAEEKTRKEYGELSADNVNSYFNLYPITFNEDTRDHTYINGEENVERPIGKHISNINYYENIDTEIALQSGEKIGLEQEPNEFDKNFDSIKEETDLKMSLNVNPNLTNKYKVKKSDKFSTYVNGEFKINPVVFDKKDIFYGYLTDEEYYAIINDNDLRKTNQELLKKYNENKELWQLINKEIKDTIKTGPSIIDGQSFMDFMKDALSFTNGKYTDYINKQFKDTSFARFLINAVERNTGCKINDYISYVISDCKSSIEYDYNNLPKNEPEISNLPYKDSEGNEITFTIQKVEPLFKDGALDVNNPAFESKELKYLFRIGVGDNYKKLKDLFQKMRYNELGPTKLRKTIESTIGYYEQRKNKADLFMADLAKNLGENEFDPSKLKPYISSILENKDHPFYKLDSSPTHKTFTKIIKEGVQCLYGIKIDFSEEQFIKMMLDGLKIEEPKRNLKQSQNQKNIVIENNINNKVNNNVNNNSNEIVIEQENINNANENLEVIANDANGEAVVNQEEIAPLKVNGFSEKDEIAINENINLEEIDDSTIILTKEDKKRIKDSIMADIVKISKNKFDLNEKLPENEISTTKGFAKGVKIALSKVNNFDKFPKEFKMDIAKSIKDKLDSCIDGVKESAIAFRSFDEKTSILLNMTENNDSLETMNQKNIHVISEGLYADALSTYLRLNEIHEKRGPFFWLFHPFQNSAEKNRLSLMKTQFKARLGLMDKQISTTFNNDKQEKKLNVPMMGDDLVEAILEKCDKETYDLLKKQSSDRQNRIKYINDNIITADNQESKGTRNRIYLNPDELYPELFQKTQNNKVNNGPAKTNDYKLDNK